MIVRVLFESAADLVEVLRHFFPALELGLPGSDRILYLPCQHPGSTQHSRQQARSSQYEQQVAASCPGSHGCHHYFLGGSIFSTPPMYGRRALGIVTLPSAFWFSSSREMSTRGLAMTVLFSVWQNLILPSASR